MQARHWVVTFNSPDLEEVPNIAERCRNSTALRNWSFQIEKVGHIHLQGYFGFFKPKRISCIEKLLGSKKFHAEKARNPKSSWEYCMKEESRVLGPWHNKIWQEDQQGKRTDLEELAEIVTKGGSNKAAKERPDLFIKYHGGIKALDSAINKDDEESRVKNVYFFYGKTGSGKTHDALQMENPRRVEKQGCFYNYKSCDTVIFDEAEGFEWKRGDILKLTDRYPIELPIKGGWVNFNPKTVIFISNDHPSCWLPLCDDALKRRVTEVRHYTAIGKYTVEGL